MEDKDYQRVRRSDRRAAREHAIDRGEFHEWRPRSTVFKARKAEEDRKQCRKKVSWEE